MKNIIAAVFLSILCPACTFGEVRFDTIKRTTYIPDTNDLARITAQTSTWNTVTGKVSQAALTAESNRIDSIVGDITQSYCVVSGLDGESAVYNGTYSYTEPSAGKPQYEGTNEFPAQIRYSLENGRWEICFESNIIRAADSGNETIPPTSICDFYMGHYMPLSVPTNRESAFIGQLYTDGTNETIYIRRN